MLSMPIEHTHQTEFPVAPEKIPTDPGFIEYFFQHLPSNRIKLQAVHATRAWNLPLILLSGCLASSTDVISPEGKRHRSSYMGWSDHHGNNPDLSFSVGIPDAYFASENPVSRPQPPRGVAFVTPLSTLAERPDFTIKYGGFKTASTREWRTTDNFITSQDWEPAFEKYRQLSHSELQNYSQRPPTLADLEILFHLDRKFGFVGDDPAEVGLGDVKISTYPRLDLKDTTILIPASRQQAVREYIERRLRHLHLDLPEIRATFPTAPAVTTADELLAQYPNIYWYPHHDVTMAVKALSLIV